MVLPPNDYWPLRAKRGGGFPVPSTLTCYARPAAATGTTGGTARVEPSRLSASARAATMIGADRLKPLKVSQRPSDSSHKAIGTAVTETVPYCS